MGETARLKFSFNSLPRPTGSVEYTWGHYTVSGLGSRDVGKGLGFQVCGSGFRA